MKTTITNDYKLKEDFINHYEIYKLLCKEVESNPDIIKRVILIPYKTDGFVVFDLIRFEDNYCIYNYSTTAS
jgi:hypothetical protein